MANTGFKQAIIVYKVRASDGVPLDTDGDPIIVNGVPTGRKQAIALLIRHNNPNPALYDVQLYFSPDEVIAGQPTVEFSDDCPTGYITALPSGVVLDSGAPFAVYNGADAQTVLPTVYTLSAIGDYFEIRARFPDYTYLRDLSLVGFNGSPTNANIFSYSSFYSGMVLRDNSQNWINFANPLTAIELNVFTTWRVEIVAGGWQLSKNGVVVNTVAKISDLKINNVGKAYVEQYARADVAYLNIHTVAASQDYTYSDLATGENVTTNAGSSTATIVVTSSDVWELVATSPIVTVAPVTGPRGQTNVQLTRTAVEGHIVLQFRNTYTGEIANVDVVSVNDIRWILETGQWDMLGFWFNNEVWNY